MARPDDVFLVVVPSPFGFGLWMAHFSPTMLGATTLEVVKNHQELTSGHIDWSLVGVGFVVSFLVAIVVIRWFVELISRRGFAPFGWYRIVAGSLALVWLLAR